MILCVCAAVVIVVLVVKLARHATHSDIINWVGLVSGRWNVIACILHDQMQKITMKW